MFISFYIFFFICLPDFAYSSKAKGKVCKVILALIHLQHELPPLFMKVITQSSLIKIQHQVKFFIKEGHVNLSTMLNLKRPMDVLA